MTLGGSDMPSGSGEPPSVDLFYPHICNKWSTPCNVSSYFHRASRNPYKIRVFKNEMPPREKRVVVIATVIEQSRSILIIHHILLSFTTTIPRSLAVYRYTRSFERLVTMWNYVDRISEEEGHKGSVKNGKNNVTETRDRTRDLKNAGNHATISRRLTLIFAPLISNLHSLSKSCAVSTYQGSVVVLGPRRRYTAFTRQKHKTVPFWLVRAPAPDSYG